MSVNGERRRRGAGYELRHSCERIGNKCLVSPNNRLARLFDPAVIDVMMGDQADDARRDRPGANPFGRELGKQCRRVAVPERDDVRSYGRRVARVWPAFGDNLR